MATQTQGSGGAVSAVLMAGLAGLVVSLGIAFFNLLSGGHSAFNTGSDGVSWGLPVVNYVFFALTSTGLTLVASVAMTFGNKAWYPIAKRCVWLSLVTLVAGFASLALELGHPFRMLWAIPLNAQLVSPLNWMGIFYAVFLVLGILKFLRIHNGDWNSSTSKQIGLAALVTELLAGGMLGMAFGAMAMRPMWYGNLVPLYFILTAACTGAAFAVLVTCLSYDSEETMPAQVRTLMRGPLPTAFAGLLGITILVIGYRTVIGLWSNADGLQVWDAIVASPWYWIEAALLIGAFFLLLQRKALALASVMVIGGFFIDRYDFVIGGQLAPLFKGSWVPDLIAYTPSTTEWMLTLLAFSIAFLGWALGEKLLKLDAAPQD
ncbi:polysulfide reductase NrfD [Aromatoleum toluolicum]|uniref:Polysulfide reductase n=1 Tax=Aromatoleum toluolicum TaxID=90060 RepID=A0ABX1NAM1_9RHOO|nr:NrfD/PsrC family molybdoenzyme membrane anchor subunit [Aromatoleum toluolicum]NMF96317.1 polysulfide reductase NrfD [Aromatoleum toluolicum]